MPSNPYAQVESYRDGDIIAHQGDDGRELYVVQSGRVRLTYVSGSGERSERVLERGGYFGELSLLQRIPREETATAIGETKLLVLEPGSLLLKIRRDPTFAFSMLQRLSRQVVDLERIAHLRDATGAPPPARLEDEPPALTVTVTRVGPSTRA